MRLQQLFSTQWPLQICFDLRFGPLWQPDAAWSIYLPHIGRTDSKVIMLQVVLGHKLNQIRSDPWGEIHWNIYSKISELKSWLPGVFTGLCPTEGKCFHFWYFAVQLSTSIKLLLFYVAMINACFQAIIFQASIELYNLDISKKNIIPPIFSWRLEHNLVIS